MTTAVVTEKERLRKVAPGPGLVFRKESLSALALFDRFTNGKNIPQQIFDFTRNKIEVAEDVASGKRAVEQGCAFFPINPRRFTKSSNLLTRAIIRLKIGPTREISELDDIPTHFPALNPKYGISPRDMERVYEAIPPHIEATYKWAGKNGETKTGYVVGVPLTVLKILENSKNIRQLQENVRPIIDNAVTFMKGIAGPEPVIGLSGMMPPLTNFGRDYNSGDAKITAGHDGTLYLLWQNYMRMAEAAGLSPEDLKNQLVGSIGWGSINRYMITLLAEQGLAGGVVVYDKLISPEKIAQRAQKTLKNFPDFPVFLAKTPSQVHKETNMVFSATSSPAPVIDGQRLFNQKGKVTTVVGDDGQPTYYYNSNPDVPIPVATPVGHTTRVTRTWEGPEGEEPYSFGGALVERKEGKGIDLWGCELNVLLAATTGAQDICAAAPASPKRVKAIASIAEREGFTLPPNGRLQNYGKEYDPQEDFEYEFEPHLPDSCKLPKIR